MQLINIQVGQCGNQLGEAFYDQIFNEISQASPAHQALALDSFFHLKDQAQEQIFPRAILVDMEPKVVNSLLNRKNASFQFDKNYSVVNQMGSGNNWAYGFNTHGPTSKQEILNKLRLMLESVDFLDGIMIWQSLAGGTGSGLGSYITKIIKEEMPEVKILNTAILPNINGEVIIQNYNCLFSIGELQLNRQSIYISDGLILIENDNIQKTCRDQLNLKNPNIADLNKVISKQLASVFYPVIDGNERTIYSPLQNKFSYVQDLYENLLLDPDYKLLKIFNVPTMAESSKDFTNNSWQALEKRIVQMMLSNSTEANINWQITMKSQFANRFKKTLCIYRGQSQTKGELWKYSKVLRDTHSFDGNDKSISVVSNGGSFNEKLEKIIESANSMFQQKAFFYQFEKYGIGDQDFINNIAVCESVLHNYKQLV